MPVPEIPPEWIIRVRVGAARTSGSLTVLDWTVPCVVGRNGLAEPADKVEGDGRTPIGVYALRYGFYRPDRFAGRWPEGLAFPFCPATAVHEGRVMLDYAWGDTPSAPSYNRLATIPAGMPHGERLARSDADHIYDVCIPIGYNDATVVPGKGSGIFLHQTRPDFRPTDGCVAVRPEDMLDLLPRLRPGMLIDIA
jgi:L,D-peptidoglycan transpeptidase YkuD (ErfK/YbiS/YcfS/YnhG family)